MYISCMTTTAVAPTTLKTAYLARPHGRLGYDVAGAGPLVLLVPGMGDLRDTYRYLAPALRDAGYRVACTDLRGHGDSDVTFTSYGDVETAGDIIALIEELGDPAVVVGNSMAAGSATLAAAERPDLIRGLVLVGAFVRNPRVSAVQRFIRRVAMARPWAALPGRRTCRRCTRAIDQTISRHTATRSWRASDGRATPRRSRSPHAPATLRRKRAWRTCQRPPWL